MSDRHLQKIGYVRHWQHPLLEFAIHFYLHDVMTNVTIIGVEGEYDNRVTPKYQGKSRVKLVGRVQNRRS